MPIRTAFWKVTAQPEQLPEAVLPSEKLLEDMRVAQSLLLSGAWMLIGRQEQLYGTGLPHRPAGHCARWLPWVLLKPHG